MDEIYLNRYFVFPRGFFSLVAVLTLGMAGFTLTQTFLSLYLSEIFNFNGTEVDLTCAAFVMVLYTFPIIGGWLAQKWLGYVFACIVGLCLVIGGLFSLCFENLMHLYFGLALFAIGNALAVACLYVILSQVLTQARHKRIAGFTIAYTAMNAGALCAITLSNWVLHHWSYQSLFLLSLILFISAAFMLLLSLRCIETAHPHINIKFSAIRRLTGLIMILFVIPLTMLLLHHPQYQQLLVLVSALIAAIVLSYAWGQATTQQRYKLRMFLVITLFATSFWALHALEPTAINQFISHNTNHSVSHFAFSISDFFTLNPLIITVLGVLFSLQWLSLNKRQSLPSLPYKFAAGIACMSVAFLLLAASTYFPSERGTINSLWVVVSYIMLCAAELLISPIGIAMVGALVPYEQEGSMMGIWLLSNGVGCFFGQQLSQLLAIPSSNPLIANNLYSYRFCEFGLVSLFLASILALCTPRLTETGITLKGK